jgi:digeranylgeranylglycerophospholipid reductase
MDCFETIIVGGGPSGSLAAISALHRYKGLKIAIFEQREKIGHPPHCSGLIGINGLKQLKIYHSLAKKVCDNQIRKARFFSPSGISFILDRKKDDLLVLDRPRLDTCLAKNAKNLGASLNHHHSIKKIKYNETRAEWMVSGLGKKNQPFNTSTKVIISAEGHHPKISPQASLPTPSNAWFFPALQYEMDNVIISDKNTVELYFGNKIAPGFYAWLIPLNESMARIGLAIHPLLSHGVRKFLEYTIKKHPILSKKLEKSVRINSWGGFVPAHGPISKTYADGFMVVGDAAGQTKATTGGGFNIGGYCGLLAGKVAAEAIISNNQSSNFLKKYQRLWHSIFEPNLSIMKLFRRCLSFLPDKTLDAIFNIAIETGINDSIQKVQDVDLHGIGLLKYSLTPHVLIKSFHQAPQAAVSLFHGLTH